MQKDEQRKAGNSLMVGQEGVGGEAREFGLTSVVSKELIEGR